MIGDREVWMTLREWRDQRDDPAVWHRAQIRAAQQARRARLYGRMLARLGERLSAWGGWLQEHYGNGCAIQLGTSSMGSESIREH
jgi:hypothetical protein